MESDWPARPGASPPPRRRNIAHLLASAAWLSVLLGIVVECAVLAVRFAAGTSPNFFQSFVEFIGSVSWSTIVCSGIALGTAATRQRGQVMGILGAISAPLGWAVAKGLQRGAQWMLGTPLDTVGSLVVQVGALKTLEYCLLGYFVGRALESGPTTLTRHALLGFAASCIFGASIIVVNIVHAPGQHLARAKLFGLMMNELLFPIGCALILHVVAHLPERLAAAARAGTAAS